MIPDYTLVIGVDAKHLDQLSHTWPTWKRHKPSLLARSMIVFMDRKQVTEEQVLSVVKHPDLRIFDWPVEECDYGKEKQDKWNDPQRYKMLSGFVHTAGRYVYTKYWLKIDTDTVADGQNGWIDEDWFENDPAIVSHPWGFTKPANQMMELDEWMEKNRDKFPFKFDTVPPLDLKPRPGSSRVSHKRIISWVGFFRTDFTANCSIAAECTAGRFHLPVASQDGFMWYMAKRMGQGVVRTNMKSRGFQHWSTMKNIIKQSREAME